MGNVVLATSCNKISFILTVIMLVFKNTEIPFNLIPFFYSFYSYLSYMCLTGDCSSQGGDQWIIPGTDHSPVLVLHHIAVIPPYMVTNNHTSD